MKNREHFQKRMRDIHADQGLNFVEKQAAFVKLIDEVLSEEEKEWRWPGMHSPVLSAEYLVIEASDDGSIVEARRNENPGCAEGHRALGVCCETEREAEFIKAHTEARLEVVDLLKKLNEGWRPDWDDDYAEKHYAVLDHDLDEIFIRSSGDTQILPCWFHSKTKGIWIQVIKELGEEKVRFALCPKFEPTSEA